MAFDPSKPFETEGASGGFDPTKPFEPVTPAPSKVAAVSTRTGPQPAKPLAGAETGGIGGLLAQVADQMYRTYAGAGADALDSARKFVNAPIDATLRAVGSDLRFERDQDVGAAVAEPVGAVSQFTRDAAPYLAGAGGMSKAFATFAPKAVQAAGALRTGIAAGAPVDAALSAGQDQNLSSIVAAFGGPTLPTARQTDDSVGEAAIKDMVEGGALGGMLELAMKYLPKALPGGAPAAQTPVVDPALGPVESLPPVQAALPEEAAPPPADIGIPIAEQVPPVMPPVAPIVAEAPPLPVGTVDPNAPPPEIAAMPQPVVQAWIEGKPEAGVGQAFKTPPAGVAEPPVASATEGPEMAADPPVDVAAPEVSSPAVAGQGQLADVGPSPPSPTSAAGRDVTPAVGDVVPGDGQVQATPIVAHSRDDAPPIDDTPPAPRTPILVRGDEVAPPDADLKTVRASAKDYFERNLRGRTVHSQALGKDVKFLNPRKSISTSAKPEKLRLFSALPQMVEEGRLLGSRAPEPGEAGANVKAYHFLEADITLGNQPHKVVLNVREDNNGHVYYNHGLEDEAVPPAGVPIRTDSGGFQAGNTTPRDNIDLKAVESKATDDLTDADIEALYLKNFATKTTTPGPTKLMSGVDPDDVKNLLVDPAVKVIKKEIDGFKEDAAQVARDFKGLRENVDPKKALDAVARTGRKVWWTNTAAIRAVAAKHKDIPEVQKIADMIGTDPGRGRVVEQTYERAVQMRSMGMANRTANVLGEKVKPEFETRVADALAGRLKPVGGSGEEETARRLRKLLDEQHEYLTAAGVDVGYIRGRYYPRIVDEEAVLKDAPGFKAKAAEVYAKMDMSPEEATQAAEEWYGRILGVQNGAYASGLPSSKATKGRTLPPEADEILKDFYSRDPRANLAAYFRQTSQAAEFARRFGKNGEKVDELFNSMLKKGMDPRQVENVRHHFESAAGLLYRTRPDAGASALSWIQTAGVLRLLPRAVISSAAEALAVGIRAHDVGAGFKALGDSYAEVFGMRAPDDMKATAEMLGIVGDAMNDLVIAANFGGEVGGQLQQKLLSRFFKTTQLHQITQAQRLAAARVGQSALRTMMQDVIVGNGRQKSASRWLAELGIPGSDVPALSKWLSSDEGRIPFAELLGEKKEAVQYRTALQRFVDESIQNPTAADRPQWANHPYGKLAYGITAFMFSFTRNVLIRTGREAGEGLMGKGYTLEDRARLLTPALMLGVLTAAQSQVSEFREMLLNPGASDEKSDTQKIVQNLSRAGAFGNVDPFINIAMSARYNRDLTSSLTGPYLTAYLDSLSKVTVGLIPKELGGPNTPNTNNAEWQAAKASYEMIAAPMIAAAASYAPGGPVLRVGYGAGLIKATSPGASKGFADKVVGERDVKPGGESVAERSPSSDELSTDVGDLDYTPPELESGEN
jgi:hypothetical protein